MSKEVLLNFLQSQRVLTIASHDQDDLWVANVYMGIADDFRIFFISSEQAKHSQQIIKNPAIAFATNWFNENNHGDRKGVQGRGVCTIATAVEEITKGVELHNQNYPEFKKKVTVEWIKNNEYQSRVWVIKPTFTKFWNDELYKDEESAEFTF